jgi:hypothetical protein
MNQDEDVNDITFLLNEVNAVDVTKIGEKRVFELSNAMLNAREFNKMKTDYSKVKKLCVDMNIQIKDLD